MNSTPNVNVPVSAAPADDILMGGTPEYDVAQQEARAQLNSVLPQPVGTKDERLAEWKKRLISKKILATGKSVAKDEDAREYFSASSLPQSVRMIPLGASSGNFYKSNRLDIRLGADGKVTHAGWG